MPVSQVKDPSILLPLLATVLLLLPYLGVAQAQSSWSFSKENFNKLKCNGTYDTSNFAKLDRVCEDCYNQYREPELHTLCREECFSTEYFPNCLQSLCKQDEQDAYVEIVSQLAGSTFDVLPSKPCKLGGTYITP